MSALLALGINVPIYERGASGIPTTTYITDLAGRIERYEHSIIATGGFEALTVSFPATLDEALDMLASWLMRSTVVTGPDADVVWEGALTTIDAQIGQEVVSRSVDGMANRVNVRYTTILGTPGNTSASSDSASIALYGTKDAVISIGTATSGEATDERAVRLAELKNPRKSGSSDIASGDLGNVQMTLHFTGWYYTLDWLVTEVTTTSDAITTTQVGTLLTTAAATNAFVSTSTANIVSSGRNATQKITADTTIRAAIENLLKKGNGTNRYYWGVFEDRKFYADVWAGATPSTYHYQRSIQMGELFTMAYGVVSPWQARPNTMRQVIELLDAEPVSTAADAAARDYVERVVCSISRDQIGLRLEPTAYDSAEVRLSRIADKWSRS